MSRQKKSSRLDLEQSIKNGSKTITEDFDSCRSDILILCVKRFTFTKIYVTRNEFKNNKEKIGVHKDDSSSSLNFLFIFLSVHSQIWRWVKKIEKKRKILLCMGQVNTIHDNLHVFQNCIISIILYLKESRRLLNQLCVVSGKFRS